MGVHQENVGKGTEGQANCEPQTWHVLSKSCVSTTKDQRGDPGRWCCEERGSEDLIAQCSMLPKRLQLTLLWLPSCLKTQDMGDNLLTFHFVSIFLLFFWKITRGMRMGWLLDWATSPCHTWSARSSQRGPGNGSSGGFHRGVAREGCRKNSWAFCVYMWMLECVGSCERDNA